MKITSLNEQVYIQQVSPPAVTTTATVPASYIDVTDFERFAFLISVGDVGVGGTVDAQVVQATAAAGTGSKNITGAVATQLVAADDNVYVVIEVQSDQLDIANDFRYVAITVTVAATVSLEVLFLGLNPRHVPVTSNADEYVQVAG
jgi:hypothetical protein